MIFLFIFATSKINLSENKKFVSFSSFLICKAPSSIPLYCSSTSKHCIIFQSTITVCVSSDVSKHQHQLLNGNDFAESMHHFTKTDQRLSSQTLLCCFHIQIRNCFSIIKAHTGQSLSFIISEFLSVIMSCRVHLFVETV